MMRSSTYREECTALYTLGAIELLARHGFVRAPGQLTARGRLAFEALVAEGFTPDKEDMADTVRALQAHGLELTEKGARAFDIYGEDVGKWLDDCEED